MFIGILIDSARCDSSTIHKSAVNKKILILNHDIDELSSMRQMFAKEGCEVITASNWETALKLFSNIGIDYLVLDANNGDLKNLIQKTIPTKR